MAAVGFQVITVSRDGKTVDFSIMILDKGSTFQGISVTRAPDKTTYRQYEKADWTGLIVTEVIYSGDPRNPPVECSFTWSDTEISISHPYDMVFSSTPSGEKTIAITKGVKTAFFNVIISGLNWYVQAPPSLGAFDGNTGLSPDAPLPTVQKALEAIKAVYSAAWPLSGGVEEAAVITVSGEITNTTVSGDMVKVEGAYPPILLKGNPGKPGTLNAERTAANMGCVLYIGPGNTVTLGENLTLTGGFTNSFSYFQSGSGVQVDCDGSLQNGGVFNMTGGTIKGNTGGTHSGGVYVGSDATFTKSSGSITNTNIAATGKVAYIAATGNAIEADPGTYPPSPQGEIFD
jgi:hypothetical protein